MTAGTVFIKVFLAGSPWARAVMNFFKPDGAGGAVVDSDEDCCSGAMVVVVGSVIATVELPGSALICFLGVLSSSSLLVGGGGPVCDRL